MKLLQRQIGGIREYNRLIARTGCQAIDQLRCRPTPELVGELQGRIVQELGATERRLRTLSKRKAGRAARLRRAVRRAPSLGPFVGEHNALLAERERLLQERRELLRSLGDACAWVLLRESPRLILPLYAERPHALPDGAGLAGPLQIMENLHASGDFLVVDADTTSCVGQGDLVVVRADGEWRHPLCFEIKSSEELVSQGVGEVSFIAAVSDDPADVALHDAVVAALGLKTRDAPAANPRVARQERELTDAAELMATLSSAPIHHAMPTRRETWRVIRNVLERAAQGIVAFDVAEAGIAYAAIPATTPRAQLDNLLNRLQESGFPKGHYYFTARELLEGGRMTAVVPPVALWPLPLPLRAALLTRAVHLACVFDPTVWEAAAAAAGIECHREGDWWLFGDERGWARFDPVEVRVLQFGLAFGGISPQAVAARVAEILAAQEPAP